MKYTPTIGLEIHAELATQTKMFCNSKNDPDEVRPNVNVCPVCMGFPGTLPVVNREAVKHVLKVGTALGGTLADYTEFDRKNYFYPDLPKGYQISQYEYPLISGGSLNGIQITRVHLEEDTARSQHAGDHSVVDFNRGGLPLMELVTEPVIHDAKTASMFAEELQLLLRYLGAGEANMEKGQMRVEANISISDSEKLGTKVEVKNLNSFKAVEQAIAYEIKRQSELLNKGEKVVQETRGWNENKAETFSQRIKEDSHDYRYFPDPDIPKFRLSQVSEFAETVLREAMPELPWQVRERYVSGGLKPVDAEVLVRDRAYAELYDLEAKAVGDEKTRQVVGNLLLTNVRSVNPPNAKLQNLRGALSKTAGMYVTGQLSSNSAAIVLLEVLENGGDPMNLAQTRNLIQVNDADAIKKFVTQVVNENPKVVADVRGGKEAALKYLVGQGMKVSKGAVNPGEFEKELKSVLGI